MLLPRYLESLVKKISNSSLVRGRMVVVGGGVVVVYGGGGGGGGGKN